MTTSVEGLNPSCDENGCDPTKSQVVVCFLALYLIALGTGGIKEVKRLPSLVMWITSTLQLTINSLAPSPATAPFLIRATVG